MRFQIPIVIISNDWYRSYLFLYASLTKVRLEESKTSAFFLSDVDFRRNNVILIVWETLLDC